MTDTEHPNRVTLEIPPEKMATVTVGGYTFFRGAKGNEFQCATCLNLMAVNSNEDKDIAIAESRVRKVKITKDCDCAPQK